MSSGRASALAAGGAGNGAQRWAMQVVKVGVGDQDGIDRGKVLDAQAGAAQALEDEEPAGEDGIDDHVRSADLQEEGGVADEGDAHLTFGGEHGPVGAPGALGHGGVVHQPAELDRLSC